MGKRILKCPQFRVKYWMNACPSGTQNGCFMRHSSSYIDASNWGKLIAGFGYVQSVENCPLPQKLTGLLATNKKKNLMLQHLINLFYYSNVHAIFPFFISLLLGFVLCFMILFLLSDSWFSNSFLHLFPFSLINGLFSCRKHVSH